MSLSMEYMEAIDVSNDAGASYGKACKAYRNRDIDDIEFGEAIKLHDAAVMAFDFAFALEQERG